MRDEASGDERTYYWKPHEMDGVEDTSRKGENKSDDTEAVLPPLLGLTRGIHYTLLSVSEVPQEQESSSSSVGVGVGCPLCTREQRRSLASASLAALSPVLATTLVGRCPSQMRRGRPPTRQPVEHSKEHSKEHSNQHSKEHSIEPTNGISSEHEKRSQPSDDLLVHISSFDSLTDTRATGKHEERRSYLSRDFPPSGIREEDDRHASESDLTPLEMANSMLNIGADNNERFLWRCPVHVADVEPYAMSVYERLQRRHGGCRRCARAF